MIPNTWYHAIGPAAGHVITPALSLIILAVILALAVTAAARRRVHG